jgi:hypothetical protein
VSLGLFLLVLGFGFGTDSPISTTVAGQSHPCANAIPIDWLVSGQPTSTGATARTPAERRLDARINAGCEPLARIAQWAAWGGLGLGGLVLLAGWTALREHEEEVEVARRTDVPAAV